MILTTRFLTKMMTSRTCISLRLVPLSQTLMKSLKTATVSRPIKTIRHTWLQMREIPVIVRVIMTRILVMNLH